jgi:hypothetical protein
MLNDYAERIQMGESLESLRSERIELFKGFVPTERYAEQREEIFNSELNAKSEE